MNLESFSDYIHLTFCLQVNIMDARHYWPFAQEYSVWNATVAALHFWTADLELHILSDAIEWVYTAFFYSNSAQQLQYLPKQILFSCFMTTLNNTFEIELAQEDEGYERGSKSLNIPTPLRRVPRIYHILTRELSFNPTTPFTTAKQHPVHSPQRFRCHSPVWHCLVFCSSEESPVRPSDPCLWHSSTLDSSPVFRGAESPLPVQHHVNHHHMSAPSTDQFFMDGTTKENFPTAPLDDDIWSEDQIPDRHLFIHDTSQPTHLYHYSCPYVNLNFEMDLPWSPTLGAAEYGHGIMDLSNVSVDMEDIMTTTSDEDISDLEDISGHPDSSQLEACFA